MSSVTLELPFPPAALSPNARVHWRVKAVVAANYRSDCAWEAVADKAARGYTRNGGMTPPVRAAVTFVVPDRRRRDLDNLLASLKSAWDGLCDAGVLAGDDAERFRVASSDLRYEKGKSCVIVELKGAEHEVVSVLQRGHQ